MKDFSEKTNENAEENCEKCTRGGAVFCAGLLAIPDGLQYNIQCISITMTMPISRICQVLRSVISGLPG